MASAEEIIRSVDQIEALLRERAAAWTREEEAWQRLLDALEAKQVVREADALAAAVTDTEAALHGLQASMASFVAESHVSVQALAAAAAHLAAIDYDSVHAAWRPHLDSIRDLLAARTAEVETLVQPIEDAWTAARDHVQQADSNVAHALQDFDHATQAEFRSVEDEVHALEGHVTGGLDHLGETLGADIHAIADEAETAATDIGHLAHSHGQALVSHAADLGKGLEELVAAIVDIADRLAHLRDDLGEAVGGATAPIGDIRAILENLLDRFRHI